MHSRNSIKGNLLLIDDEYAICVGVSGLLELNGFKTDYAFTAEEGVEFLEKHPETDVVLLDINLGVGMSGTEALPVLRERFRYAQVMMFTSHDDLETGLECMKKGACDYLTKPFNEQEFLKKVPEALAKKQLAKLNDLYLGILVHDLKNPLQCIMGAWELAKVNLNKAFAEKHTAIIGTGDSGIVQIKAMIENILTVSKFEAGTVSLAKEKFDADRVAETALAPLRQQFASSDREFAMTFDCATPHTVVSDSDLFSRVLFNIVSNAQRYTPSGGSVSARFIDKSDGFLHAEIRNTGSFVDPGLRHSIFDKFSSVHKMGQAGGVRNYGLGLTFSKMAVEAMGGSISVESEEETPSTTFLFSIRNFEANKNKL
jgi:two-component system, sensor histidine kinase and response regulator